MNIDASSASSPTQQSWQSIKSAHFYYKPVSYHNVIQQAIFSDQLLMLQTTNNDDNDNVPVVQSLLVLAKDTLLELCQVHLINGVISTVFEQAMFGKVLQMALLRNSINLKENIVVLSDRGLLSLLSVNWENKCFETCSKRQLMEVPSNQPQNIMKMSEIPRLLSVDPHGRVVVVANVESVFRVYFLKNCDDNSSAPLWDDECDPMEITIQDTAGQSSVIWHIECLYSSNDNNNLYVAVVVTMSSDPLQQPKQNSVLIYRVNLEQKQYERVVLFDVTKYMDVCRLQIGSSKEEALTQHVLLVPSNPHCLLIVHGSELMLMRWRTNEGYVLSQPQLLSRETYQEEREGVNGRCVLIAGYNWSRESYNGESCPTLILTTEDGSMFECTIKENGQQERIHIRQIHNVQSHTSLNVVVSLQSKPNEKLVFCSGEMCNGNMYEVIEDAEKKLVGQQLSAKANLCPAIDFETYYQNYYSEEDSIDPKDIVEERNERKTLVCTSTNSKSEAMRIVRRGVGIQAISISDEHFSGINGLWTLKSNLQAYHHMIVVLGFLNGTRVLLRSEDSFEDISSLCSFDIDKRTLVCETIGDMMFLQVTHNTVRIIRMFYNEDQLCSKIESEWLSDRAIAVACYKEGHLLLGMSQGNTIKRLRVDRMALKVVEEAHVTLSDDASAFEILPDVSICFIGTYQNTIQVLRLDTLERLSTESLSNTTLDSVTIVQSMLAHNGILYVGLRDGTLILFTIQRSQQPMLKRALSRRLGLLPVSVLLTDYDKIIATSNTTHLIQFNRGVFDITVASMDRVLFLVPFNTLDSSEESFIAVAEDCSIDIYILDYSQSMNIRPIPVEGAARRVILSKKYNAVAFVLCDGNDGSCYLQAISLVSNKTTVVKQFLGERLFSICEWTVNHGDTSRHFIVIGTQALTSNPLQPSLNPTDSQKENPRGNIHLLELEQDSQRKHVISSKKEYSLALPGVAYAVHALSSKHLIVSAGHRIVLTTFENEALVPISQNVCRHFVQSISGCPNSNVIAVTDRFDSVSLFQLHENERSLRFLENERTSRACASALMVDRELVVGVDRDGGFFAVEYEDDDTTPVIDSTVYFNMHEIALSIKPLSKRERNYNQIIRDRHVTCITVCGSIINFLEIPYLEYVILERLQQLLCVLALEDASYKRAHLLTSGGIDAYRSRCSMLNQPIQQKQVVDGEFITDTWNAIDNKSKQTIVDTIRTENEQFNDSLLKCPIDDLLDKLNRM